MIKSIKYIGLALFLTLAFSTSYGADATFVDQGVDTITFKVEGVCMMCKERIENAAYIKGVKFAEWDKDSGVMTVVFKPKIVSEEEIHQSIANAGHRTNKMAAEIKAYNNLPRCCAYDDGAIKH